MLKNWLGDKMEKIRAVIIGFAHMHVNEIAQYISEQEDFNLVGFADVPPKEPENTTARYTRTWNLNNNSEKYNITPHDDYIKMLDELKPDIAFILCENDIKPQIVLECAKRGINVSIEKPMAVTLDKALEIKKIVDDYGIEAIVNWPVIWRPYIHKQLAALESGVVGKLIKSYYINGHTGPLGKGAKHRGVTEKAQEMTDDERASTWWYKSNTGGGAFLDIGCYGCFFNTWARSDDDLPLSVSASAGNYNTPYMDAPDNVAGIIEYKDSLGVYEGSWTVPQAVLPTGPIYMCTDGVLYCTPEKEIKAMDIYGNEIELPDYNITEHIANIADHYAYCKKNNLPLIKTITLDYNIRVMALLDASVKSAISGKKEPISNDF